MMSCLKLGIPVYLEILYTIDYCTCFLDKHILCALDLEMLYVQPNPHREMIATNEGNL